MRLVDTFPKSSAAECYRGFRLTGSCARLSPVAERSVALLHALVLVRIAFSGISGAGRTLTSLGSVVAIYAGKGTLHQNQVGQALTFTRWQLVTPHLPLALPSIATGVQLALIYPWVASIGAEYFMTVGPGIGGLIVAGRERFQVDLVILRILILALVGLLINWGASAIETRLLRWRMS